MLTSPLNVADLKETVLKMYAEFSRQHWESRSTDIRAQLGFVTDSPPQGGTRLLAVHPEGSSQERLPRTLLTE